MSAPDDRECRLPGLTALEVASSLVMGGDADAHLPDIQGAVTPRSAFESAVLAALQKPPCIVSFSGGRDSSAVLAVAAHVARREGLSPPVACTLRFPGLSTEDEDAWQQRVIGWVAVDDWVTLDAEDVDCLGPIARQELRQHGLLFPPNAFFHAPIARVAVGGTVLTGVGGDEIMTASRRWRRLNRVLTRQRRPALSDLGELFRAYAPFAIRRAALRRRENYDPAVPWLRPAVAERVRRQWEREVLGSPVDFRRLVDAFFGSRSRQLGLQGISTVISGHGARAAHPFGNGHFLAAMARHYGRVGPSGRSPAMRDLFGDLLPEDVQARSSKAYFDGAFWGAATQHFVSNWDGTGLDEDLVDPAEFRRHISRGSDYRTFLLLQDLWLAQDGNKVGETLHG